MKKTKIFIILFLILLTLLNFTFVFAAEEQLEIPNITANSYIVIDNKTNKVLYNKNENKKMYPASTTKILTAIITLENCNLDDTVTASYDAVMSIPEGYSTANIQIGEKLTVEQLLEVLLVHSANDAANVLAEFIGGSIDSFVNMMNTKLNELGANNSHFTNAYGLHDENHYTTAKDLAKIMQYCLKNETFRKISGQASCAISATNKYGTRSYSSTNELLDSSSSSYYNYLISGKTGFTTQSQGCLVSAAFRDNLELVGVVLYSSSRFADTRRIYDYAYSNYSIKDIINSNDMVTSIKVSGATKEIEDLNLLSSKKISALVNNNLELTLDPEISLNEKISAPIEEGDILGKATYTIDGISYETNLIAEHHVEKSNLILYVTCGFIGIILIFIVYKKVSSKKNKRKKYNRFK